MQLASNTDNQDSSSSSSSETQPILKNQNHLCEIIPIPIPIDDNESSHLLVVNADHPQCRICLDLGGEDLIAPCHCKGTQKYVHRSCLDNWRSTKEGFAFSHCTECRALFIIRPNVPKDRWWLRLKFQFLVARDHAFIFIIVQLVVAFLGVLIYKFYEMNLEKCLVIKNIHTDFTQWLFSPLFWWVCSMASL